MNKNKQKQISTMALVGLIALSLVGCSSMRKESETNKKPQSSQTEKGPVQNKTETKKGPVQTKPGKQDVVKSIEKTQTDGLIDTFTVKYVNDETTTFTITYGEDETTIDKIKENVKGGEKGKTIEIKNGTWHFNNVDTKIKAEGIRTSTDKKG